MSLTQKFTDYHTANPGVYRELVRLSYEWKRTGHGKIGMQTLIEKLRWDWNVSLRKDSAGFRINNNFAAFYSRMIMEEHPDLQGMFDIRERRVND
jgi:hypothetical protein